MTERHETQQKYLRELLQTKGTQVHRVLRTHMPILSFICTPDLVSLLCSMCSCVSCVCGFCVLRCFRIIDTILRGLETQLRDKEMIIKDLEMELKARTHGYFWSHPRTRARAHTAILPDTCTHAHRSPETAARKPQAHNSLHHAVPPLHINFSRFLIRRS